MSNQALHRCTILCTLVLCRVYPVCQRLSVRHHQQRLRPPLYARVGIRLGQVAQLGALLLECVCIVCHREAPQVTRTALLPIHLSPPHNLYQSA